MRLGLQLLLLPTLAFSTWAADEAPQTSASARAGATIPSAAEVAAQVPTDGKLSEKELILMAIARRPDLEALRGAVQIAAGQKRAAGDLENPELRFSYAQDNDDRIGQPYTESETVTTDATESFDVLSSTSGLEGTRIDRESGVAQTSRLREIERRVTPGATKDVIEERIYETNTSRSTGSRTRLETSEPGPQVAGQRVAENRRLVGTNRREIHHPDASGRDNAWGVLLRFRVPHPWERRARIRRAAAEITLAESQYYAREDEIVRTVRGTFQELSLLKGKLTAQSQRKKTLEDYRDWLEANKTPRLGLELASARAKVYNSLADIRKLESEISTVQADLAAFCGLAQPERIDTAASARRVSDPAVLDIDYLTNIAMLYRSDVLGSQARLALARAQLAEAKATRIPFATFLDLGYTQVNTLRRTGMNEEWFVRMGVSIPLWEWTGINKRRKAEEITSQAMERQLESQRDIVSTEVTRAVKRLAEAESQLARQDKDLSDIQADMKKALEDAQAAAVEVEDVMKGKRIENEFLDLVREMEISRFSALSSYHEALMSLEKALGVRLERALRRE